MKRKVIIDNRMREKEKNKLEELGLEAKSAELERIPNNSKEVTEEQFKINMKMLDRFEEDDDVQNVYHNMEITDALLDSL